MLGSPQRQAWYPQSKLWGLGIWLPDSPPPAISSRRDFHIHHSGATDHLLNQNQHGFSLLLRMLIELCQHEMLWSAVAVAILASWHRLQRVWLRTTCCVLWSCVNLTFFIVSLINWLLGVCSSFQNGLQPGRENWKSWGEVWRAQLQGLRFWLQSLKLYKAVSDMQSPIQDKPNSQHEIHASRSNRVTSWGICATLSSWMNKNRNRA